MKWHYKGKRYYLDIKAALLILAFLLLLPAVVAWGNNIPQYFNAWTLIGACVVIFLIYKNCVHITDK